MARGASDRKRMEFDLTFPYGAGNTERAIEIPWALSRYRGEQRVLEVGCSFATENPQYIEGLRNLAIPELHGIDISSVEASDFIKRTADIRESGYETEFFDMVLCISTIEHVGRDNSKHYKPIAELPLREHDETAPDVRAMTEMLRILKRGGKLILTVPFGRFVDYGWFINYDSAAVARLLSSFRLGAIQADYFQYTSAGWMPCAPDDLADTAYGDNGAPAAAGVACFEITKRNDDEN